MPMMNAWPHKNSVLIMDNCPVHMGVETATVCFDKGVILIYLPTYSPDLNPIEKSFDVVKNHFIRSQEMNQDQLDQAEDIEVIYLEIMYSLTPELMTELF